MIDSIDIKANRNIYGGLTFPHWRLFLVGKKGITEKLSEEAKALKVPSFDLIWLPVKSMEIFVLIKALAIKQWLLATVRLYFVNLNWHGWSCSLLSWILKMGGTNLEYILWNSSLCQPIVFKVQH